MIGILAGPCTAPASSIALLLLTLQTNAGTMPASLAKAEELVVISAARNHLTGHLVDYASAGITETALVNPALRHLDLGANSLTG